MDQITTTYKKIALPHDKENEFWELMNEAELRTGSILSMWDSDKNVSHYLITNGPTNFSDVSYVDYGRSLYLVNIQFGLIKLSDHDFQSNTTYHRIYHFIFDTRAGSWKHNSNKIRAINGKNALWLIASGHPKE